MAVVVKLSAFEGPLDLLLHLIEKAEVDIYDIPIAQITAQYLESLEQMRDLQLDVTSEFLVMAATLLAIKSKMLLPKPELSQAEELDETGDPRDELVQRLLEYKKFKEAARLLQEREGERSQIFTRPPMDLSQWVDGEQPNPVANVTVYHLLEAFRNVLMRVEAPEPVVEIQREEISVRERSEEILQMLRTEDHILFSQLFAEGCYRSHVVVTFISLLELMKLQQIQCKQSYLFSDIEIQLNPNWREGRA
ncbi:segregation and condensation protein A [Rubeoparvulum massiliense]|uniref:segregation and condensation protein A n=1 Tax=Rubeoparvulum massiliense TaxID=1631346 RepID=UPI00065E60EF|nr:segregation/condensation protein A [Rubeoparvulum massiliense]